MTGTNKNRYQKYTGDNNTSSANEMLSNNVNQFNFPETASTIVVCFLIVLMLAAIIWLCIKYGGMVGNAVFILFILFVLAFGACGLVAAVCFIAVRIFKAKAQISYYKFQPHRNYVLDASPTSYVLLEPPGRTIRVENAQQVSHSHQHPAPQTTVSEWPIAKKSGMPSMYDLTYASEDGER